MTLSVSLGDIVTKYVCDPICGQIPYLLKHKRNVEELTEAIDELTSKPNDIQREVATLTGAGKINTCQINQWLEAVGEIEEEATRIKDEYEQGRTCLRGLGTNYWSSYRLSKRAVKLKIKADRQCEKLFERLAITPPPESAIDLETGTIEDQPTAKHTKEEVLNYIADDRISVIGVYGMGGIGKTTLMENVNNHLTFQNHFDVVIMVTISAHPNFELIRERIGKLLHLNLSMHDDVDDKKHKLLNVLRTKRYLIILDDMWKRLDLKEIGIPQPKKQDGCKIVVESRRKDVCHNMQAECIVEVKKLSDEEAWSLFLNNAGHHISSQLTEPHARKVLKKCGGLPLAIITLARAMPSKESKEAWEDALRILNMSAAGLQGMDDAFGPLKFSYDRLDTDDVRSFFLYCALVPQRLLNWKIQHNKLLCKKLKKLPPTIGKLNQLQMLDLEGCTAIKELDSGLAELTNLIFLNLSAMSGLKSLPTGLLCSLVNLEYLNVFISGGLKWSTARSILEESWMSAWELTRLVCLSYPSICIKGVMDWDWLKLFPQRLLCLGLTDCTLTNDAFVASEESQSIEFFSFLNCKGMKGAPSPRLGYLEIKGSKDLECVMVGEEAKEHSFQSLEVTYLEMLPKLERICIGVPPHVCFGKLKNMNVEKCPSLRVLFTNGMVQ
ncbi:probable disease resistance protein At1g61310 [Amborella trichopoda]|uniref:probable disease resistance protein At1g61310 n=1 Tax=Amborella trichopoda TaxID=13333 RepID=UPI0009BD7D3E|nr:probable disease resistance protein At1g61310 [Amborella trichopoda]|eukprot:XP_020527226.1 probable disease resistance protein At1g61310 [Amborella trichopoda]